MRFRGVADEGLFSLRKAGKKETVKGLFLFSSFPAFFRIPSTGISGRGAGVKSLRRVLRNEA
jgi:hypothetical protein